MKLRRAMATAAATAVIAPLALLSAPAAFAEESPSTPSNLSASESSPESAPSTSEPESTPSTSEPESTPSTSESESAPSTSEPEVTPSSSAPSSDSTPTATPPSESAEPTDEPSTPSGVCEEDNAGYKSKLDAQLNGLPGKIAVGSGWHPFTLSVKNPTQSSVKDVVFYAGVGPSDPNAPYAFKTSQVQLQVKYDGVWVDVTDDEGHSVGYLDLADIAGGKTVTYQLRVNVKANAPIGEGLTIGGGLYFDEEENCLSADEAHYIIQIVKAGTDTGGTKPQEGGKVPVPTEKPNQNNTQHATGSLAETGSSSMVPTIGLVGGVAVVVGAGALFAVRRRKAAPQA
ncbi:LAETG motif-containing sortase-dependent surface protein [Streptomyces carpinensis]|uniref:LAETG motif-containing sortase-dependent surface protein n=1 Tax=Streptomyces carpinensis TaxID=66369 RepID=A0ABV1VZ13_9ACTN|nr:LAETG motif-containing sortase-dependent surface protein [Streptomyces carpinensis]